MRRRTFLKTLSTGTLTAAVGTPALSEATTAATTIDSLEFDSTSSLLDANQNYLTNDSTIAVTAESTAYNEDADDNGNATFYDSTTPIPLVAVDGAVVGFGATLVSDEANFRSGNEEFLLNVWDAHLGGSGTVLFDEGHDQYHTLNDFGNMKRYAETQQNYTVSATSTLTNDLSGADAVWLTGPTTAFSSSELDALSSFVADGGAVFIHDRADYQNQDETANLNAIADALGLTSYNTIIARYGTWLNALDHLDVDRAPRVRFTETDCIEALQAAAEELGPDPTMQEYDQADRTPTAETIAKRFDGWQNAKAEAGVTDDVTPTPSQ